MTAYLEGEDQRTDVFSISEVNWFIGLFVVALMGVIVGLFFGVEIGENREHDRICNSPQPPYTAPVAIPACGV